MIEKALAPRMPPLPKRGPLHGALDQHFWNFLVSGRAIRFSMSAVVIAGMPMLCMKPCGKSLSASHYLEWS